MKTETVSLSIIIPLHSESEHIDKLVKEIRKHVGNLFDLWELILVDDGSTDNTWPRIESQVQNVPLFQGIKLSRHFGKEAALCAGLEAACGQIILVMDGDFQHPPSLIPLDQLRWTGIPDSKFYKQIQTRPESGDIVQR